MQKYKNSYNRIDKNLASVLLDAVDSIADFLKDAQIQENDDTSDIADIIPSIQNEICQSHRYYYCKACNQSVKASAKSFNEHFYGNKHLKKLREVERTIEPHPEKPKKNQLKDPTLAVPNNNPKWKERLNSLPAVKGPPEINLTKKARDFLTNVDLDQYTVALLGEGMTLLKSGAHIRVCESLQRRLAGRFPDVHTYPFGSVVVGLGRYGGDLDIFIDIGNCFTEKPSKRKMKDAIHQTQRILMANANQWGDFEPVTKARTPILKVFSRTERIDCDLSFSNGLSHCNTILIGYFVNLQPVCKKLAAFVKLWVNSVQLGLNSYLVTLMVIFYLQQEQMLPSVKVLQDACEQARCVDGWQANFVPLGLAQLGIPMATDFKRCLIGFFRFYSYNFNFEKHVISVLTGAPVEKSLFDHGKEEELPAEFERFKTYMSTIDVDEADEVEDLFSNYKPLVIQDPFELCHNVAKGVQQPKLLKMLTLMQRTHEILVARNF